MGLNNYPSGEERILNWQIFIGLMSALLVFLSSGLGVYFSFRSNSRKTNLDEVAWIVEERRKEKEELKRELDAAKIREHELLIQERACQNRLRLFRRAVERARITGELPRLPDDSGGSIYD